MSKFARFVTPGGCGLALALLLAGMSPRGETATEAGVEAESCCYTHPGYSGRCEVTPGEGESCASILAYLNNPNSHGKAYCGGTALRGGWRQVSCDEKAQGQSRRQSCPSQER